MTGDIVLGYDGSDGSKAALRVAVTVAKAFDAPLTIVFGYEPNPMGGETADYKNQLEKIGNVHMRCRGQRGQRPRPVGDGRAPRGSAAAGRIVARDLARTPGPGHRGRWERGAPHHGRHLGIGTPQAPAPLDGAGPRGAHASGLTEAPGSKTSDSKYCWC